jgi:hypothetical protein
MREDLLWCKFHRRWCSLIHTFQIFLFEWRGDNKNVMADRDLTGHKFDRRISSRIKMDWKSINSWARCHNGVESINHMFMQCPRAMTVWFGSHLVINYSTNLEVDLLAWLIFMLHHSSQDCGNGGHHCRWFLIC